MRKIVEVDLQAKGTDLHDANVVGDTVGQAKNCAPTSGWNAIDAIALSVGAISGGGGGR